MYMCKKTPKNKLLIRINHLFNYLRLHGGSIFYNNPVNDLLHIKHNCLMHQVPVYVVGELG